MIDSVLLIRPKAIGKKEFPLGLLYVGTALKNKGYKVRIIDLQDTPEQEEKIIDILASSPNTILGINALAPHYRWVKDFTLKLKKIAPHIPIAIGGHIAVIHERLLLNTGVDYVCIGEGEDLFPELIEKINKNEPKKDVKGLAFKEGGEVVNNGWRPYVKSFLMPDYKLVDINRYLTHPSKDFFFRNSPEYNAQSREDDKLGVIMFSRGCVGGCNFCYRHLPGFRQASIEWSWKHLKLLHDQYGVKYFRIDDELFTNNFEWFKDFHRKIIDSKINILFRITGLRVDTIDENLLKMLKEMGCIAINYGIESCSQKMLDNMNKRTTVAQNLWALQNTLNHGMQTMAYIIIGYEEENEQTLKETLSVLLESRLSPEYISIFYAVALPGTKLYKDSLKNGKIKDEEKYLEKISAYIEEKREAHEYYFINFSELSVDLLKKWEKRIIILTGLKKSLTNHIIVFETLKKIIIFMPFTKILYKVFIKYYNYVKHSK
jgi:radical SAM superfamily enzyme YgiQ (UPF0313 family)